MKKTSSTPTWRSVKLGETLTKIGSGVTPRGDKESYVVERIPLIRSQNVLWGKLSLQDVAYISAEQHAKMVGSTVQPMDVLLNITGASIGRACVVPLGTPEANVNQHVCILRPKKDLTPQFLLAQLLSTEGQRQIDLFQAGGNREGLNYDQIRTLKFSLPPLPEQRKIADILSTWDETLETLDALIAAKTRQKQALMQHLLTGKTRVKGAKGKWKKVQLGELAENRSDQNKGKLGTELLYGVTKADGVVPMRDHVKGESFHRCKLLEHDWFAYNPMRINIGSIARWQGNKTVMVSGDYVVFRCFEDRLSPAYLDQLRQSWMWQSFVTQGGNGSVRIRIYFSDLAEFTFPCPPLAEQQKIAAILDTADQELTLLRTRRQTLDQQKRGLMQRLLTGKTRVKP
jgi:type I restriction enzyme S subunit